MNDISGKLRRPGDIILGTRFSDLGAPSRDGLHIAFASLRSGRRQIWAMDNDGRNPVQLSQFETDVYDGRMLSDGKTGIFLQLETPQREVLVMEKGDGEIRRLIQNQTKRWEYRRTKSFWPPRCKTHRPKGSELLFLTSTRVKS